MSKRGSEIGLVWVTLAVVAYDSSFATTTRAIFNNISENIEPIKQFLIAMCYISGLGLTFHAIMKLKKFGFKTAMMHVEVSVVTCFAEFFAGVGLIYTPSLIASLNWTFFSQGETMSVLDYDSGRGASFDVYLRPILGIIQIIGIISFLKGWLMLGKIGQQGTQPGTISKAITHIVGGILAINVILMIKVVNATMFST